METTILQMTYEWNANKTQMEYKLNEKTGAYELIADRQTWDRDVPIERFMEKLTQQYARLLLHREVKEKGFVIDEEWELDNNSIELTVSRWT